MKIMSTRKKLTSGIAAAGLAAALTIGFAATANAVESTDRVPADDTSWPDGFQMGGDTLSPGDTAPESTVPASFDDVTFGQKADGSLAVTYLRAGEVVHTENVPAGAWMAAQD